MNEIIVLKQLPEIVEQLDLVSKEVSKKVETAMKLVCTEDTVKEVKKTRAELNKEFNELESQRKQVKQAIMAKYDEFEDIYKDKVANLYKQADTDLKAKIDNVEQELKDEKEVELKTFAEQWFISKGIEGYVKFEDIGLNITLSASMKSLKDQIVEFCEKVESDIKLIELEEYKEEILFEYQETLDFAGSKLKVVERHRLIDMMKELQEKEAEKEKAEEQIVEKVEEIIEPPKEIIEESQTVSVTFTVTDTVEKIRKLKEFMKEEGINYE